MRVLSEILQYSRLPATKRSKSNGYIFENFYLFSPVFRVFDPLDVSFVERAGLLIARARPNAAASRGVWSPVTIWLGFFGPRTQQITSI